MQFAVRAASASPGRELRAATSATWATPAAHHVAEAAPFFVSCPPVANTAGPLDLGVRWPGLLGTESVNPNSGRQAIHPIRQRGSLVALAWAAAAYALSNSLEPTVRTALPVPEPLWRTIYLGHGKLSYDK
jgi:hypothetical protein